MSSPLPAPIDFKLVFKVKRILDSDSNLSSLTMSGTSPTPAQLSVITTSLVRSNREYSRVKGETLEANVVGALEQICKEGVKEGKKKRRRSASADGEEEAMIKKLEEARSSKNGNMLNNSLAKKTQSVKNNNTTNSDSETKSTSSETKPTRKKRSTSPAPPPSSSSPGGLPLNLTPRPTTRYADLGGINPILQTVRELVEYPLTHPELYTHIGVEPPRGVLLHGPPGCGKTLLANAMAGSLGCNYIKISAPEIVSGMSGESEEKIRAVFQFASDNAPAILFIDEVDAIMSKRDGSARGMEKRIVAQLLTCMDGLNLEETGNKPVMVIGATNRPDSIDSALRRAGRFDREIGMGVPDEEGRKGILKSMTEGMRLDGDFDFDVIARKTPGYVGADIRSLTKEAAVVAINRIFKEDIKFTAESAPLTSTQLNPLSVQMSDFLSAVKTVQPSAKREGFATVPDVSWNDIGALSGIRNELQLSIVEPISHPEKFIQLGLSMPAGVMLFGPPGCGKTLLAKAIANESGANFISVKGPELLDKYVGESERAVRQVFERARASSPCIVFFDELDSLCPRRGSDGGGGGGVSERVVNQLLTELDGLDSRKSVFVVAATNRPELIDPAMLRPGRLDKLLYVPLPKPDDRASILKALSKGAAIASDVDVEELAKSKKADGYSGADLSALLREAGLSCLKENMSAGDEALSTSGGKLRIQNRHFVQAFKNVMPSVSKDDQKEYDKIRDRISRARSRQATEGDGERSNSKSNK